MFPAEEEKIVYIFSHIIRDGKVIKIKAIYNSEFDLLTISNPKRNMLKSSYLKKEYSFDDEVAFKEAHALLEKQIRIAEHRLQKLKGLKISLEDLT